MAKKQIIKITSSNIEWFSHLCPPDFSFYESQYLRHYGALADGVPCGILICQFNDIIMDVEYLYVHPDYRRCKVASALLNRICEMMSKANIPVVCTLHRTSENMDVFSFFESQPYFTIRSVSNVYEISANDIPRSDLLSKMVGKNNNLTSFFELPKELQNFFLKHLLTQNIYYLSDFEERRDNFVKELCICQLSGKDVLACVFIEMDSDGNLVLSYAYSSTNSVKSLVSVFAECFDRFCKSDMKNRNLKIAAVEPSVEALIEKIFPIHHAEGSLYVADCNLIPLSFSLPQEPLDSYY